MSFSPAWALNSENSVPNGRATVETVSPATRKFRVENSTGASANTASTSLVPTLGAQALSISFSSGSPASFQPTKTLPSGATMSFSPALALNTENSVPSGMATVETVSPAMRKFRVENSTFLLVDETFCAVAPFDSANACDTGAMV